MNSTNSSKMMRNAHYIVSTHWDREWYESFQGFRMRFVSMFDEVMDHLQRTPAFASFEVDGQVLPLLDYLEVRSGEAGRLRELCAAGRVRPGPWYNLPDEWLVSGESLVRNLQLGLRLTADLGAPRPTNGPLIDQFGHTSQMPQILAQLGLRGTSLHRGIDLRATPGLFRWAAPDGSTLLVHRLGRLGYGTMQIFYRRVLEADEPFDFDKAVERLVEWTLAEAKRVETGPILMLDTCDHVEIEPRAAELLAAANAKLAAHGIHAVHSNSDAYLAEVEAAGPVEVAVTGELRNSAKDQPEIDSTWLISGVLSSRVPLKQANARCEDELCLFAEPLSAFASAAFGRSYPQGFLDVAWKSLLDNHPHDSICGCSIDQVHKDMEYRFDQSIGISERLSRDALRSITLAAAPKPRPEGALVIGLFNPTTQDIDEPLDLEVRLPATWAKKFQEFFGYEEKFAFRLRDADGRDVPWQLTGQRKDTMRHRQARYKIPAADPRHLVNVTAQVKVPAFGYTTLTVEPVDGPVRHLGSMRSGGSNAIENARLRVAVNADGTIHLTDKVTGHSMDGLLRLEDGGDIGDGWNWCPPANDAVVSPAGPATVTLVTDGPEKATLRISVSLDVPEEFDYRQMRRSDRKVTLRVEHDVTLRRGGGRVEVRTTVHNCARDHRLRVLFPTRLQADTYLADAACDVVERPVALAADNGMRRELDVDGRPQQSWCAYDDGKVGLAVVSRGLYESGVVDVPERPLLLTLLRSFRRAVFATLDDNPGGQIQGTHVFRYDLVPFAGAAPVNELFVLGQRLHGPVRQVDLLPQESAAAVPGHVKDAELPRSGSFLNVDGKVVVTSVQQAASGETLVRLFNPHASKQSVRLTTPIGPSLAAVRTVLLDGGPDTSTACHVRRNVVEADVAGHRIVTFVLGSK
jgi:alpha-mannosidase/mannosylglycerate hydrolase